MVVLRLSPLSFLVVKCYVDIDQMGIYSYFAMFGFGFIVIMSIFLVYRVTLSDFIQPKIRKKKIAAENNPIAKVFN